LRRSSRDTFGALAAGAASAITAPSVVPPSKSAAMIPGFQPALRPPLANGCLAPIPAVFTINNDVL
jgi:hypothetical protein